MSIFRGAAAPTERLLVRLIAAWAVAAVLLATFWEVLLATLWLYALGFWVGYAIAGVALVVLAVRHRRIAASRARWLTLAASVPAFAVGLWFGAEPLRAGGNALAAWVRGG